MAERLAAHLRYTYAPADRSRLWLACNFVRCFFDFWLYFYGCNRRLSCTCTTDMYPGCRDFRISFSSALGVAWIIFGRDAFTFRRREVSA